MESHSKLKTSSKRVIIRAHEYWHDSYEQIIQDWFTYSGFILKDEVYQWAPRHYVHLGGVNGGRFHLIIDMEKDGLQDPQARDIPYEVYRYHKRNEKSSSYVSAIRFSRVLIS